MSQPQGPQQGFVAADVPLEGHMDRELWPSYLHHEAYVQLVVTQLRMTGLSVRRLINDSHRHTSWEVFVVGDEDRSRKLALHYNDPKGRLYLLEDQGTEFLLPIKPVSAITLQELTSFGSEHAALRLQLTQHPYPRLSKQLAA
jgi:hypothetical protein